MIEEGLAKTQIATILTNIQVSQKSQRPMCQDTGIQTFYVSLGVDSPYRAELNNLIAAGVKVATQQIPLRPNTVDPLTGDNHQDNTGHYIPHVTWELVPGDKVWVSACASTPSTSPPFFSSVISPSLISTVGSCPQLQ